VAIAGARSQFQLVSTKYLIVFGSLALVLVCGILANAEPAGPILSEMRYMLRCIPFFFLPAVLDLKEWQLERIMKFVLALSLIQVPLSMYQRYFLESTGHVSGDGVTGTIMDSGCMTLFLICVICVLAAAMLRGRISKFTFGWIFMLLLIPMSIDETKITVFLFPPALLGTFLVASTPGTRVRIFFTAIVIMIIGGSIFIPTYDYFNELNVSKDEQFTVADIMSKDFLSKYLTNDADVGSGERGKVARANAVVVPLKTVAKDPIKLAFGLGIGNVSTSTLGPQFVGQYFDTLGPFASGYDSGAFLLETGVFGFVLILLIHWLIFRDSVNVARQDPGLVGIIAAGWTGTTLVIVIGIFYTQIHGNSTISYFYWLFSGFIAARRTALLRANTRGRTPVPRAEDLRPKAPVTIAAAVPRNR
jgi:hypothetical protein